MTNAPTTNPAAPTSLDLGAVLLPALTVANKLVDAMANTAFTLYVPAVARLLISSSIVTQAVDYGFGMAENAVKGEVLDLPVASNVVAEALTFLRSVEPSFLSQIVAPAETLIVARLAKLGALPKDATAASLGLTKAV